MIEKLRVFFWEKRQMLSGKVSIKKQGHLELPLFGEEGTLRGDGQGAFCWRLIGSALEGSQKCYLPRVKDIDFNTNGDLNWTLSSLRKFPSPVRKPWTWHSREYRIGLGLCNKPQFRSATCHHGAASQHLPSPSTLAPGGIALSHRGALTAETHRRLPLGPDGRRTVRLQVDCCWAMSFLLSLPSYKVSACRNTLHNVILGESGAWQDESSEHSRIRGFPHTFILRLHFKVPASCFCLRAKGMGRGINNLEEKFSRDEFIPNRNGVGRREKEAELHWQGLIAVTNSALGRCGSMECGRTNVVPILISGATGRRWACDWAVCGSVNFNPQSGMLGSGH